MAIGAARLPAGSAAAARAHRDKHHKLFRRKLRGVVLVHRQDPGRLEAVLSSLEEHFVRHFPCCAPEVWIFRGCQMQLSGCPTEAADAFAEAERLGVELKMDHLKKLAERKKAEYTM